MHQLFDTSTKRFWVGITKLPVEGPMVFHPSTSVNNLVFYTCYLLTCELLFQILYLSRFPLNGALLVFSRPEIIGTIFHFQVQIRSLTACFHKYLSSNFVQDC